MVNPMESLIETFYVAFRNKDAATMISCYHDDVIFQDPAFGELKGEDARAMWTMLCRNAVNLKIQFSGISASVKHGSAHWEAWYTFSKTGNKVHNIVEATFEFKDAKIIKHTDGFNLHKWASQALGWKGWLIGGTNFFKNKIQLQTRSALRDFKEKTKKQ
ncbi:MAG: nuclear transport factor 2 family protein [Ginsengibacter sp.]